MTAVQYRGTGYAKLLLFGEHAAVYGHPAVGIALADATTVTISPGSGERWYAPNLAPAYRPYLDELTAALEKGMPLLWPGLDIRAVRGRITVDSTVPVAQGFGSSASLCVALAEAALKTVAAAPSPAQAGGRTAAAANAGPAIGHESPDSAPTRRIWKLANHLEHLFHGRPSGIDTGLALYPGMSAFNFGDDELPAATRLGGASFSLVTGAVPRTANTREQIAAIGRRVQQQDRLTAELLAELGAIAADAIELLPRVASVKMIRELGAMANRAHTGLKRLGLDTPQLAGCLKICRDSGSVGGKLSGAGGGGAFYALFTEEQPAVRAAAALAERATALDTTALRVVTVRDGLCRAPETTHASGNKPSGRKP